MNLLSHKLIKNQLDYRSCPDLKNNNNRLNVIIGLYDNTDEQLINLFDAIIADDELRFGYYQLQNLFAMSSMTDPNIIINLIIKTISKKVSSIQETILNENNGSKPINLAMYIQLWKNYKNFCNKIYTLLSNYQNYLTNKNIKSGAASHDIFSILQTCMFYDEIINHGQINTMLTNISKNMSEINKTNIEQLIEYIDSIRMFMSVNNFTSVKYNELEGIILDILNNIDIVNVIYAHMHSLLKDLTNHKPIIDKTNYETTAIDSAEKYKIKQINKIVRIISLYVPRAKLLACHYKYMQLRIIDPSYDNLELELDLVRRMCEPLGKADSHKLVDTISDIIQSRKTNEIIHGADIRIKTDKYKDITDISLKNINPIIITKHNWKIYNITDLEPIYPSELQCYFDIIKNAYDQIHENKYTIRWQPTLGFAQFSAQLGTRQVGITCNILQAMALTYMNDHPHISVNKFSHDHLINEVLASKIIDSLVEANLIIGINEDMSQYGINEHNYNGDSKIDIRKIFVETFEIENPTDN